MLHSRLIETPVWREAKQNPPLSPRKADKAARNYIKTLISDSEEWIRTEIRLCEVANEHWIYEVVFVQAERGVFTGPCPTLVIVVLMDGQVVPYMQMPEKERKQGETH